MSLCYWQMPPHNVGVPLPLASVHLTVLTAFCHQDIGMPNALVMLLALNNLSQLLQLSHLLRPVLMLRLAQIPQQSILPQNWGRHHHFKATTWGRGEIGVAPSERPVISQLGFYRMPKRGLMLPGQHSKMEAPGVMRKWEPLTHPFCYHPFFWPLYGWLLHRELQLLQGNTSSQDTTVECIC